MKKQVVKILLILIISIFLLCLLMNENNQLKKTEIKSINNSKTSDKFVYERNAKIIKTQNEGKKEYQTMPSDLKGYKVIGKLEISKISLATYILEETTDKTLKVSVTKLEGPQINEIGNFCVIGHNYFNSKMFFKLNKVQKDDEIILTNTFDEKVRYRVYEIKEILPNEVEILNQNTQEEREVTLITCTFGAGKRIVVKAVEIYD